MSYGLQVKDGGGNVKLSVTDRITRLLYTRSLSATETGSISVPGFDATRGFATAMALNAAYPWEVPHLVTCSGSTVSWQPVDSTAPAGTAADSVLLVFMYA